MRLHYGKQTSSWSLGIYLHNWGWPINYQWEFGLYLLKWYIGIDFFKEEEWVDEK